MNQPSSDLWTPTTDMVRHSYAFFASNGATEPYEEAVAQFDRWLLRERAQVKHDLIRLGYRRGGDLTLADRMEALAQIHDHTEYQTTDEEQVEICRKCATFPLLGKAYWPCGHQRIANEVRAVIKGAP